MLEKVSPDFGLCFMAAAIMISTFGCVNGMILMGARLYYAMAQDKLFFRGVGSLNSRGVPAAGLILQGIWAIVLVFSGSYDELLDFVMFTVLMFYVLTVAGLFILRWRQPNLERPYRAFGYPLLPALYVLACAAICVVLLIVKPENTWPGLDHHAGGHSGVFLLASAESVMTTCLRCYSSKVRLLTVLPSCVVECDPSGPTHSDRDSLGITWQQSSRHPRLKSSFVQTVPPRCHTPTVNNREKLVYALQKFGGHHMAAPKLNIAYMIFLNVAHGLQRPAKEPNLTTCPHPPAIAC